jgi:hypothetical protein
MSLARNFGLKQKRVSDVILETCNVCTGSSLRSCITFSQAVISSSPSQGEVPPIGGDGGILNKKGDPKATSNF